MSEHILQGAKLQTASKYLILPITDLIRDVPPHGVVADLGCGNGSVLTQNPKTKPAGVD
jgi:16S rRNA G1207 methylase RsmC